MEHEPALRLGGPRPVGAARGDRHWARGGGVVVDSGRERKIGRRLGGVRAGAGGGELSATGQSDDASYAAASKAATAARPMKTNAPSFTTPSTVQLLNSPVTA